MKQPEPIEIKVPYIGDKIMYSMMSIGTLMKLRRYLDKLIKWKALGNPVKIMDITYEVTEIKEE